MNDRQISADLPALFAAVEARAAELVELISTLVRFETPAPPARNTGAAQDFIARYLADLGFAIDKWDVFPGDPNVVARRPGDPAYKSLIINGHVDVAEVRAGEVWRRGPFQPFLEDGMLFGRGTADMKGGLAGALFALRLLRDHGVALPGELIFQSVIGEEVGEAGTLQCCERGYSADFALVVDTSELDIQGQGGVITGWITLRSPQTFHDAMRRRMVHAGGGTFGANTIEKMAKIIQGLNELERHWAVTKSYPGCPPGTTTINPAVIEGGRHAAFIPDECRLWVTVHFYPNETHEQIAAEIEAHVLAIAAADPWMRAHPPRFVWGGRSMIVERGEIFPALELDPAHPAVGLLAAAHARAAGAPARLGVNPSVTDGGWFGAAGIPAAIYGPGELRHAHAIDERVSMAQMMLFTKSMLAFITSWLNTKR